MTGWGTHGLVVEGDWDSCRRAQGDGIRAGGRKEMSRVYICVMVVMMSPICTAMFHEERSVEQMRDTSTGEMIQS